MQALFSKTINLQQHTDKIFISLQITDQKNIFRITWTFLTHVTTMIENRHMGKDRSLSPHTKGN